MLNHRFQDFCDRWLKKAREYDETELSQCFDKFFTLFVVYNALYSETAALLYRKARAESRNDYKMESDHFPDSEAATKYVLDLLGSRNLLNTLKDDLESSKAIETIIDLMDRKRFNVQLDPVWGRLQPDKDQELLASLKSNSRDNKARAILTVIYSIRCNIFHGRKGFVDHQEELLIPATIILRKVIDSLYRKLKSAPVYDLAN